MPQVYFVKIYKIFKKHEIFFYIRIIFRLIISKYIKLNHMKMTAGSIAVPTIVPLRAPVPKSLKNLIDTCTPIEIKTGDYIN
jgi:hypothetical protein